MTGMAVNILPQRDLTRQSLTRSEGRSEIIFKFAGNESRLAHFYQSGCARVRFPSVHNIHMPEAVMINTAGGLTGGDRMDSELSLQRDARLTVTAQAAEKIYKSVGPAVEIRNIMNLGEGAFLEWMPQETILFNHSSLDRLNKVQLTSTSRFLGVETTLFGRLAHGENVEYAMLKDGWKIWRDGRLIWIDALHMHEDFARQLDRPALLDGARALATLIYAGPDSDDHLPLLRDLALGCECRVAATAFDGFLVTRFLAPDGFTLRQDMTRILKNFRAVLHGADIALPRVWEI